jgi:hypothetical protein
MTIDTAWKIAVAIFAFGGFVVSMRRMKGDLNGLGLRTRRDADRNNVRFLTIVIATLVYEEDLDKRRELGKMFLESGYSEGRR